MLASNTILIDQFEQNLYLRMHYAPWDLQTQNDVLCKFYRLQVHFIIDLENQIVSQLKQVPLCCPTYWVQFSTDHALPSAYPVASRWGKTERSCSNTILLQLRKKYKIDSQKN